MFEVLTEIYMDDEAGASKFLNRATEEGITFSRDDFSELNMLCDYDSVRRAVLASGAKFKAKDLEYLYGEIEDDIIIEVAAKYNLMLPEDLREEDLEEDFDEEENSFSNGEIKQEIATTIEWADLAINALVQANNCMNNGLEVILQNSASHLQFSALEIAVDMWIDDNFMDYLVQLHISRVQKRIGKAIRQVENVRNELVKAYNKV